MASINLIFSRPGRGKSTLAADLSATVTRGRAWPTSDVEVMRGDT